MGGPEISALGALGLGRDLCNLLSVEDALRSLTLGIAGVSSTDAEVLVRETKLDAPPAVAREFEEKPVHRERRVVPFIRKRRSTAPSR